MNLVEKLGLTPIINGVGPVTRVGGLNLSENILQQVHEASVSSFRMEELHLAASEYISRTLGVPGALVTSGAASALTIATAVSLTGVDIKKIAALPHVNWSKKSVIIQKIHTDQYDHAVTAAGAMLRIVGDDLGCNENEIEAAIDPSVAAILWRPKGLSDQIDVSRIGALAAKHGLPFIIDAAVTVPPIDRLVHYFACGASFVAASGGKGFRGPHTGGLLFCSKQNVINALLHHLDIDERDKTWVALREESQVALELPENGIARAMKVGREQIFAMVAAIDEYLLNPRYEIGDIELGFCEETLKRRSKILVTRFRNDFLNVDTLKIFIGEPALVDDFYLQLYRGTPRIILGQELSEEGWLTINPMALQSGEGIQIAARILEITEILEIDKDKK